MHILYICAIIIDGIFVLNTISSILDEGSKYEEDIERKNVVEN